MGKEPFVWDSSPHIHAVPAMYMKESAVILKEERNIEYRQVDKDIWIYRTVHRLVQLQDDKGIEMFNKITIPFNNSKTIESIKARTISASGKVYDIGQDKIKTINNNEEGSQYIFAMEGVEKNSEIELLYTEKKLLSYFGSENFQFSIPVVEANFSLQTPEKMIFDVKGYNGFPDSHDSLINGVRYYHASRTNVPLLEEEVYSNYKAFLSRVEYKLSYLPLENPDVRYLTWKDLAKELYTKYYTFTEKETRAAEKYLNTLHVNTTDDEVTKISKIEEGIKTSIVVNKDLSDDALQVDKILDTKVSTETGYTRLFVACLNAAGVKNEMGLSSNRFEHPFDKDFENWNWMDEFVIYFPNEKRFLAPISIYLRYPLVPAYLLSNKGVFCKKISLGDIATGIADIREITALPVEESNSGIEADVTFKGEDLDPTVTITNSFSGYTAMGLREAMVLLPKDKQKDAVLSISNLSDNPNELLDYKINNTEFTNYYSGKPLQIVASIKATQLLGKAGPKYLFKIGEIIGKQEELYQTKARQFPIDMPFPHMLKRSISIHIPEGYKVINAEDLRIQADVKNDKGVATTGFISDYTQAGNLLTVSINEFYEQIHYPISDYDAFRKVINSSADFNKVVLVLVKQ